MSKKMNANYSSKTVIQSQSEQRDVYRQLVKKSDNEYELPMKGKVQFAEIIKEREELMLKVGVTRTRYYEEVWIKLSHIKRLLPNCSRIKLMRDALIFANY